ncbi:hypothetical protein KUTeg_022772 [Tegillarca granosa]|uniref:C2H2-type domain-containing protein n=1 Tax=Tegillarca granosa TaxID=220873 RepID=A0ABQ9E4B3_TEGGR|nr:hypothetical protein KUTeg_022772 [Tegillarca granosa]
MTTLEVTTVTNPSCDSRLLALRVTPEQEIAIYAFFQINGWSIITEDVPKNCLQCKRTLNGEDDILHCGICQRRLDSTGQIQQKDSETQTSSIVQVHDQQGRRVVVVGNHTLNTATQIKQNVPQIIVKQNPGNMQPQIIQTSDAVNNTASTQMISLVKHALPQNAMAEIQLREITQPSGVQVSASTPVPPKIYNMNNSAENRPYKCDDCGKNFRKKSHVQAHMKFHSGEQLPKCEICGKEFLYKHNLLSHASIHSDVHMCVHSEEYPEYKKGIIRKKRKMEMIENGEEEEEDEENVETSIAEEDGAEVKMELFEEKENLEVAQEDNKNVSIASSLLTLVEMITNAEQETKQDNVMQATSISVAPSSEIVTQAGEHYTVVPSSSFDSETLSTVHDIVNRHANGQEENIIIAQDLISEAHQDGTKSNVITQEALPPGVVVVEQETGQQIIGDQNVLSSAQGIIQQNITTQLQQHIPEMQENHQELNTNQVISQQEMDVVQQAVTIITDHEAQEAGIDQHQGVVIQTTNDGVVAEDGSIIHNTVADGQFVDGETYVMEVQFVEENE